MSPVNAYYSTHSPTNSDWPSDMEVVKKMSKTFQCGNGNLLENKGKKGRARSTVTFN